MRRERLKMRAWMNIFPLLPPGPANEIETCCLPAPGGNERNGDVLVWLSFQMMSMSEKRKKVWSILTFIASRGFYSEIGWLWGASDWRWEHETKHDWYVCQAWEHHSAILHWVLNHRYLWLFFFLGSYIASYFSCWGVSYRYTLCFKSHYNQYLLCGTNHSRKKQCKTEYSEKKKQSTFI